MGSHDFAFFERELQLVGVEPLGVPAELRPLQLPDDQLHPLDATEQPVAFGTQRLYHSPQAWHVFGKRLRRRHRDPDSSTVRLVRRLASAIPIQFVAALSALLLAARSAA